MSELPQSWQECKLEDITQDVIYGYTAKASVAPADSKMLRITDIQDNKVNWHTVPYCTISKKDKNKYQLKIGDLVFARTGATVGKSFLITDEVPDSVFASYLIRVRCTYHQNINYLNYFFKSPYYWNQITEFSVGTGQPNVNGSKLKNLIVPLAPINEQQRIANRLDTLLTAVDTCRARLDKLPALIKRFRQSVLAVATSGNLTEEQGKNTWQKINVGALLLDIRYGTAKKCFYEPQETPVIRIPNICNGLISKIDLKYATFDEKERQKLSLVAGDILIIRSNGSVDLVGRTALVSKADEGFLYAGYLIRLRANHQMVNPAYLAIALSAPNVRNIIELTARSTSGVNNINTEEIKALVIELPAIAEQIEIVRRVEALFAIADKLEASLATARKRVDQLTPSILAQAFRGELVAQDPSDEPASALLARITGIAADVVAALPVLPALSKSALKKAA